MDQLVMMGFDRRTAEFVYNKNGKDLDKAINELLNSSNESTSQQACSTNSSKENDNEAVYVSEFSQFSFDSLGSSSCTPISIIFASTFLQVLESKQTIDPQTLITDATLNGVSSYSSLTQNHDSTESTTHMSVDEYLSKVPTISESMIRLNEPNQLLLTDTNCFSTLFEKSYEVAASKGYTSSCIAVIITKPPETICVFLPPKTGSMDNKWFYLFDSHSRPHQGLEGSYLVKSSSLNTIIDRLQNLFPPLPSDSNDNYLTWMYNTFEGVSFVSVVAKDEADYVVV